VAAGFVAAWRLVRLLPERRARAAFEVVADHVHRRNGRGVRQLRETLRAVRPELDDSALEELTSRGVQSYFRYWCESFRLPSWPVDDMVSRVRTVHEERLRVPYAEGRGAIAALPHQANWDWAGAWACATGMPVKTVAERLRPERLYKQFVAYRVSLGMEILPLTGGQPPLGVLADRLRSGAFVCLLADRDLSRNGVPVELCGQATSMPPGPALLARETGAALLPLSLAYRGDCLEIFFHEEVTVGSGTNDVRAGTQRIADAFSEGIHRDPQDWHMMQRVFDDGDSAGAG
jgi:KDO2-lipid IV(A) lauroyltransferase